MTSCQAQITRNHHKLYLIVSEGTQRELRGISSRLWPLWYTWIGYLQVNGPPRASPSKNVDHRYLCQHSSIVNGSNLEMAEALSRCLQLLLWLLAGCMWRKPSYICLSTHHNSGMMMSRLRSTALAAWPW